MKSKKEEGRMSITAILFKAIATVVIGAGLVVPCLGLIILFSWIIASLIIVSIIYAEWLVYPLVALIIFGFFALIGYMFTNSRWGWWD